ncbi:MAG: alkaline phosphatase, partial [Planctomycetota bacterium]
GEFDTRSDNQGGEPEALAYGQVGSRHYIFVGMERTNVVMVFDVTTPASATFLQLIHVDGDVGPEGMKFISATDSPNGKPLLVLANEVSGNLRIYQINEN